MKKEMNNDFIALIDLDLIEEAKSRLSELEDVAIQEIYNEEYVVLKIKSVNDLLKKLFELPTDFVIEHKSEIQNYKKETRQYKKTLGRYLYDLNTLLKSNVNDKNIAAKLEELKKLNKKHETEATSMTVRIADLFDINKVTLIQLNDLFIKFAKQRKLVLYFTDYVFRSRFVTIKILSSFISFLIGSIAVYLLGIAFVQFSEFLIGFFVWLSLALTLDLLIAKISKNYLWIVIRRLTFKLHLQLLYYTDNISFLTSLLKTQYKSS